MSSWVGQTLLGRYRVVRPLDSGGMAAVYVAEDLQRPGWQMAVKHPLREQDRKSAGLTDDDLRDRFQTEISKLIGMGEHRAIVRIEAQGEHEGTPFYVMPFMAGGSLEGVLARGPQAADAVLGWAREIAKALDWIHGLEPTVLHRDVKPSNILFDRHGQACLADFGIVKELHAAWGTTAHNTGLGTRGYMAPEQVLEDGEIDARTDQYALAATMYRALSGATPTFESTTGRTPAGPRRTTDPARPSAARKRLKPLTAPDMAPHLPPAAAAAVEKALSKEQADRFDTCTQLVEAFAAALAGGGRSPGGAGGAGGAPSTRVVRGAARTPPTKGERSGRGGGRAATAAGVTAAPSDPAPPRPRARRRGLLLALLLLGLGGAALAAQRSGLLSFGGAGTSPSRETVAAKESAGRERASATVTPLGVRVEAPAEGAVFDAQAIEVRGSVEGASFVKLTVAGIEVAVVDGRFSGSVRLAGWGRQAVPFHLASASGAVADVVRHVTVRPPAPRLALTLPAEGAEVVDEEVRVTGTLTTVLAGVLRINGEPVVPEGGSFATTLPAPPAGGELAITADFSADGVPTSSVLRTVHVVARADLTIAIVEPQADAWSSAKEVAVRCTVAGGRVKEVRAGAQPLTALPDAFRGAVALPEGEQTVLVTATPLRGKTVTAERRVRIDRTPPRLEISFPATEHHDADDATVVVKGTARDENLGLVALDGKDVRVEPDGAFEVPIELEEGQERTLTFRAWDRAGNASQEVRRTLSRKPPPPRTLRVPKDHRTIQAAVDAARAGDTVAVAGGTYRECIRFKDGVNLIGEGRDECRIEPASDAPCCVLAIDCGFGTIQGFTFRTSKDSRMKTWPHTGLLFEDDHAPSGATVSKVLAESVGQRAGIRMGEKVMEVDGVAVTAGDSDIWFRLFRDPARGPVSFAVASPRGTRRVEIRPAWESSASEEATGRQYGVVLLHSSVTVEDCRCSNFHAGIYAMGARSQARITNNECEGNDWSGIAVFSGAKGLVRGNDCHDNVIGINMCGVGTTPLIDGNKANNNDGGIVW